MGRPSGVGSSTVSNTLPRMQDSSDSACGTHVNGVKISYGTALLSSRPLAETLSITFDPTPPTFSKGFLVSTIDWPGAPGMQADIVSAHLHFSRRSAW